MVDPTPGPGWTAQGVVDHVGGGDGSGTGDRITRLETHFQYIRRDLDEIKTDVSILPKLATKADLRSWAGIYLTILAIVIGGIIGGLAILKPDTVGSPPTVIYVTPPPASEPIIEPETQP